MLSNFFNSSKSRASVDANKSMEQDRQIFDPPYSSESQTWNAGTEKSTNPDNSPIDMNTSETPTGFNTSNDEEDSVELRNTVGSGGTASPISTNVHEQLSQQTDINSFKIERPPIADPIMPPEMVEALLQANNAYTLDTNDYFLQPQDFMVSDMRESFNSGDATMGGAGESQNMQVNIGSTDRFEIRNNQEILPSQDLHDVSPVGAHSRQSSQLSDKSAGANAPTSGPDANGDIAMGNLVYPGTPVTMPSSSHAAESTIENIESGARQDSPQRPRKIYADDSALLVEEQRGRRAKYRPADNDWPLGNRAASVPPRCVDHYSFVANWPPQEPPTCDFGRRVDVFPPRDAPLHLHVQAYALRWGLWTSTIKDKDVRQQVLNTVADKMKDAWENAIGENYYIRRVAPLDDSDHRNDTEDKAKKGRKRAVSPSRQPAGFTSEGKDPLAITNGELMKHSLTMDMINKRVQEKDFDAGEEVLDEVLDSLGRDQLVVKDWSQSTFHGGSMHNRNLLMYSLFVVLECRNERRKLKNLMAMFTREQQKRNTRARIETCQEREFQHIALAAELELARREENPEESHVDEESQDNNDEMEVDNANAANQVVDNANNLEDDDSVQESVSGDETSSDDHELILQVAQAVLAATSDAALYTAFTKYGMDSTSFTETEGLRTEGDPSLQAGKTNLGEILELATRLISQKEMVKREQNPAEVLKMNLDIKLSYERISQAQSKLVKVLNLDFSRPQGPDSSQVIPSAHQNEPVNFSHLPPNPQESENDTMQANGKVGGMDASSDHSGFEQMLNSSFDAVPTTAHSVHDSNAFGQQVVYSSSVPDGSSASIPHHDASISPSSLQNAASVPQNITFGEGQPELSDFTHQPPQAQHVQVFRQQSPPASQAISPAEAEEAAAKQAYIDEKWRPWLDAELHKRNQPASQGVITDWPQLRDIIAQLGYTAADRNQLLRNFKTQFDQWMKARRPAQQSGNVPQSPAPSRAGSSSAVQAGSPNGAPPGWPSAMEVAASIPPHGIHANQLLQKFHHRVGQHVNQFSNLIQQAGLMDQSYMVYPSQNHAVMAYQQQRPAAAHQSPVPDSPRPTPSAPKQQQIVKLKLPQTKKFSLPTPQDESEFPEDYQSKEVNSTRGFSFRHLPHSTFEQRKGIDDLIADYITKTSKGRKKSYYGTYVSFNDPLNSNGPPIAHGFWDNKDETRPDGSEWFYNREDVPSDWLPKLGINVDADNENDEGEQSGQYRDVWNDKQGRYVKFKLAGPVQSQGSAQGQSATFGHDNGNGQNYNTYPPGYSPYHGNGPPSHHSTSQQPQTQSQPPKPRTTKTTRGRSAYLDGNDDESVDSVQSAVTTARPRTRGAGVKRAASAIDGGNVNAGAGRGSRGVKRRKKNAVTDDDEDGDYVPGEE